MTTNDLGNEHADALVKAMGGTLMDTLKAIVLTDELRERHDDKITWLVGQGARVVTLTQETRMVPDTGFHVEFAKQQERFMSEWVGVQE